MPGPTSREGGTAKANLACASRRHADMATDLADAHLAGIVRATWRAKYHPRAVVARRAQIDFLLLNKKENKHHECRSE